MKKVIILIVITVVIAYLFKTEIRQTPLNLNLSISASPILKPSHQDDPLSIRAMRKKSYQGSDLKIEQTLVDGFNYHQYIASYKSDGLKIYGLLTVPAGQQPKEGWPVVIFNHGYIPPSQYRTTEKYVQYIDAFARAGYIVFKSDYRGNGSSEGEPEGAYYSPAYATDVLNALTSVKKYPDANPNKIGMWGHSMGGNITLRDLVVDPKDIRAAVIWGGVTGTYDDLMNNWQKRVRYHPPPNELALRNRNRQQLIQKYGTPKENPDAWNLLDPNHYLTDITAPIQLHAGGDDEEVPTDFSQGLYDRLKSSGKNVEIYIYPGDNHNISSNLETALQRSVEFFDRYLK